MQYASKKLADNIGTLTGGDRIEVSPNARGSIPMLFQTDTNAKINTSVCTVQENLNSSFAYTTKHLEGVGLTRCILLLPVGLPTGDHVVIITYCQ